jgi:opacity protein-like surface antigen
VGQWTNYLVQFGVEYDYFGSISESGLNEVGFVDADFTSYNYSYRIQTQQVMGVAKALGSYRQYYHPYVSLGLGAAFNDVYNYSVTPVTTNNLNPTPDYVDTLNTQFTYTLGIGVDTDVYEAIQLGVGYRYSNFGPTQFRQEFHLGAQHAFANQFVAQITYKSE